MSTIDFQKWLNKESLNIPFYELVKKHSELSDFVFQEWLIKNKTSPNLNAFDSFRKLQTVKDSFSQIRKPVKPEENRIEIANVYAQNIIQNLKDLKSKRIVEILANEFLKSTQQELSLLKLGFWSKNENKPSFNYNEEIKPVIDDFILIKGKVDILIQKHLQLLDQNELSKSKHDNSNNVWFKVGLEFAKGRIQNLRLEGKTGRDISQILFNVNTHHPYITQTLPNISKGSKNIYNNLKQMTKIKNYCDENGITICNDFQSAFEKLKLKQS